MNWQIICVLCVLMSPGAFYHDSSDEDFDNSYDQEEFTTLLTRSKSSDNPRKRRSDVQATTINEYDATDDDYMEPKPITELPITLPISFIRSNLNLALRRNPDNSTDTTSKNTTTLITLSKPTLTKSFSTHATITTQLPTHTTILTQNPTHTSPVTLSHKPTTLQPTLITLTNTITSPTETTTIMTTDIEPSTTIFTSSSEESLTNLLQFKVTAKMIARQKMPESLNNATTIKEPKFDVPALLAIISNLTADYDWNIVEAFNESLMRYNIPTCQVPTTVATTTPPTTLGFANASVISKCFVCGLNSTGIPYDSSCADAFSGDFIPLVPVDSRARSQISKYRKYCRYLNVPGVVESPYEPRSLFGRFTGGCSVRWVDLTGVYTQRTCRNRRRPVTGKHFGSKRMAKLELTLNDIENGCVISPMASLLPVSRGISLYARFHACVCTGEWCNRAVYMKRWTTNIEIVSMLIVLSFMS